MVCEKVSENVREMSEGNPQKRDYIESQIVTLCYKRKLYYAIKKYKINLQREVLEIYLEYKFAICTKLYMFQQSQQQFMCISFIASQ